MALELNVYTGIVNYKGIEFTFSFDGEELRMIPPKDKKREVDMWFKTEMSPGVCSVNQSVYIDSDFLEGTCNESGNGFIFIVSKNHPLGRYNSVLVVSVDAYIKKTLRCATFGPFDSLFSWISPCSSMISIRMKELRISS